ncbi:MAG: tRNA 4-thiouridine(8) synthase ThiI [Candidatus Marsarchaeota archaeon]|jgi:thiamine biosynthesis protein ThiI|nr:tRNA 4-thiouridine(8) synthase ThiI [Candidatus Marsarchaeota archaeon]
MPKEKELDYDGIVIHFGELWLKGRNRHEFIELLVRNIKRALGAADSEKLEKLRDRLVINAHSEEEVRRCLESLKHVFGISWYAPFRISSNDINDMIRVSKYFFHDGESVRIEPHRAYKEVSFTSSDIVSSFIKLVDELGFIPDKKSEKTLHIEVLKDFSIMHKERFQGLGGLPVGASGKAIVLLSGGIDSPVAAYYAMKRGLEPVYLHFYAYPSISELKGTKMPKLINVLLPYSEGAKIYYVPVHLFQIAALQENQKYEVVLFKKFIYETAQLVAEKEGSKVIVTGESLGQVSSQTAENLTASSMGIKCLFFRPLIGFDKQEIISASRRLGLYDLSIIPYKDACSLRSRNPVTRIGYAALDAIYERNGMRSLASESLEKATVENSVPETR